MFLYVQYEPGVLEACLQLLQVSPQHLTNGHKDYILRADPVYVSRVVCAMVRNDKQSQIAHASAVNSVKSHM